MFSRGFLKKSLGTDPELLSSSSSKDTAKAEKNRTDSLNKFLKKDADGNYVSTKLDAGSDNPALGEVYLKATDNEGGDNPTMIRLTTLPAPLNDQPLSTVVGGTTELIITEKYKRLILDTPGFPSPPPVPAGPGSAYEVSPVQENNKGRGVFATRDIKAGELILSERPLLIIHRALPVNIRLPTDAPREEELRATFEGLEQYLKVAVEMRMCEEGREAYLGLTDSHKDDGEGCGPLAGRLRTNGWSIVDFAKDGDDHVGTFCGVGKVASMFNHSCAPNTTHEFTMKSLSFQFYAARDIKAGEEITVTYAQDLTASTVERNKDLKSYGFKCACPRCTAPTSDATTAGLAKALKIITKNLLDENKPVRGTLELALRSLQGADKEGIEDTALYMGLLECAIVLYQMIGDAESAVRYGRVYANIICQARALRGEMRQLRQHLREDSFHKKSPFWEARKPTYDAGEAGPSSRTSPAPRPLSSLKRYIRCTPSGTDELSLPRLAHGTLPAVYSKPPGFNPDPKAKDDEDDVDIWKPKMLVGDSSFKFAEMMGALEKDGSGWAASGSGSGRGGGGMNPFKGMSKDDAVKQIHRMMEQAAKESGQAAFLGEDGN